VRKGIALFLVFALVLLLLPTPAYGVATTAKELKQQITNTYRRAFRLNNSESFNGWCATLVTWQTYLLGIDANKLYGDGKDQFDQYSSMRVTTGGYRVRPYPASQYTLREALDAITKHGTQDVYNILVGFQRTNTEAGRLYGHACFIHGVVDGMVYFMECYDASIGGKYWAEGTPISCSIEEFCQYYSTWTVLDGVIHFGYRTYLDLCQSYPAHMDAMVIAQTPVLSEPVDEGVNDAITTATLGRGEIVQALELVKTPGGRYWYAVQNTDISGYIPAESLTAMDISAKDVAAEDMNVPTALRKGSSFRLGGTITTQYSDLKQVTVSVTSGDEGDKTVHCTAQIDASGKQLSLSSASVDRKMTFRKLSEGTYNLSVSAMVTSFVLVDGQPVIKEDTVEIWNSEFRVVRNKDEYHTITFDAMGGVSSTDKITFAAGETVDALPIPARDGYAFTGWFTQEEGGEQLTEGTLISEDMTVYARWSDHTGWHYSDNIWSYLENGSVKTGWFSAEGVSFYRYPDGSSPSGWTEIDGKLYLFSDAGAVQAGWIKRSGNRYYIHASGEVAKGWLHLDGNNYWFDDDGAMQTGWLELDGETYYFGDDGVRVSGEVTVGEKAYSFHEDGRLVTGWVEKDGETIYLDETGTMVTGWQNIDGMAYYFGSDGALYLAADNTCSYGCLLSTGIGATQP